MRGKRYRERLRRETYTAYGNQCSCCGLTNTQYLQIDHIDGGGGTHRKQVWSVSADLRRKGFPPIVQLLCANCHQAKDTYGGCIHKEMDDYLVELQAISADKEGTCSSTKYRSL